MPVNRIITRGMGTSRGKPGVAGLVTQGYGGLFRFVKEQARKLVKAGQSGAKRALEGLEEVIVWAKLITVNEKPPPAKIEGFVRVGIDRAKHVAVRLIGLLSTRVKNVYNDLKVTITRIK